VPWCTDCDRFLSPSSVRDDGTCPHCGRAVEGGELAVRARETRRSAEPDEEPLPPIPWHLKLLAAAIVVYLAWRLVQGVDWLLG